MAGDTLRATVVVGRCLPGQPGPVVLLARQRRTNPTTGAALLTGAAPGLAVQVFDALGRQVATATADAAGTAALALPQHLPAGVYLVRSGSQVPLRLVLE